MDGLKLRRVVAGLTLARVGKITGYSGEYVRLWETGRREIPEDARRKLAKHYGCRVADLKDFDVVLRNNRR